MASSTPSRSAPVSPSASDHMAQPGAAGQRTVQVHPTLRCNLACRHCYSSSGPGRRGHLPLGPLVAALADLRALGYDVVAISGGEPFSYPDIDALVAEAAGLGFRVALTSNGTLFEAARLDAMARHLTAVAVSLDGPTAQLHEELRGTGSFARLLSGLATLRDSGIPFGFVHTVTSRSLPFLDHLAEFAVGAGAGLLQLHPLERTGRASRGSEGLALLPIDAVRTFVAAQWLRLLHSESMLVHVDLVAVQTLVSGTAPVFGGSDPAVECSADTVGIVVVEDDGWIVPAAYGFNRRFAISQVGEPLGENWERFAETMFPALVDLRRSVVDELGASDRLVINWFEELHEASHRRASVVATGQPD